MVAFELTQTRALLLVFPNTFEYFFIAYEAVRTRWNPLRFLFRWWLWAAGLIWVFIKLPQEYWIHVAQLDVTDTLRDYAWAWPLLIGALIALAAVALVRRTPPAAACPTGTSAWPRTRCRRRWTRRRRWAPGTPSGVPSARGRPRRRWSWSGSSR